MNFSMVSDAYSYTALTIFMAYDCYKIERRAQSITVWSKMQYECILVCTTYPLHGIQHCYRMEEDQSQRQDGLRCI